MRIDRDLLRAQRSYQSVVLRLQRLEPRWLAIRPVPHPVGVDQRADLVVPLFGIDYVELVPRAAHRYATQRSDLVRGAPARAPGRGEVFEERRLGGRRHRLLRRLGRLAPVASQLALAAQLVASPVARWRISTFSTNTPNVSIATPRSASAVFSSAA